MPKATDGHYFNVLLRKDDYRRLEELAHARQLSRGAIIRQALRAFHLMELQKTPVCANGTRCFVPQMHQPATPPQAAAIADPDERPFP